MSYHLTTNNNYPILTHPHLDNAILICSMIMRSRHAQAMKNRRRLKNGEPAIPKG